MGFISETYKIMNGKEDCIYEEVVQMIQASWEQQLQKENHTIKICWLLEQKKKKKWIFWLLDSQIHFYLEIFILDFKKITHVLTICVLGWNFCFKYRKVKLFMIKIWDK